MEDDGFTLVEVVAGIVIITIILLSSYQMLIQSNKAANDNNEKLAVIHLADATLERLKIENYFVQNAIPASNTWDTCLDIPLNTDINNDLSKININNQTYHVSACLPPRSESDRIVTNGLNLVNVRIKVVDEAGKHKSQIEGYVKL